MERAGGFRSFSKQVQMMQSVVGRWVVEGGFLVLLGLVNAKGL